MNCVTDNGEFDEEAHVLPKCAGTLVDEVTPDLDMDFETHINELDEAEVPHGVDEVTPTLGMDCDTHINELDEPRVPPLNGTSILAHKVTPALEPKTSVSKRETGESLYNINSPLTSVKDLAKVPCVSVASSKMRILYFFDPVAESSPPPQTPFDPVAPSDPNAQSSPPCKTPESVVYDSSDPALDDMLKNHSKRFKFLTPRRLSFDGDEEDKVENEKKKSKQRDN